jgi:glycosyltransferase involved in cell wall biosynthesis
METALGNTGRRGDQLIPMTANSSLPRVSVVIPTHNPRIDYLRRVLEALRVQTLPRQQWELLVVDNGSKQPLRDGIRHKADGIQLEDRSQRSEIGEQRSDARQGDLKLKNLKHNTPELELGWHPNARIVREEELGLTFARLRGFAEAKGELIVMVDDDNVLAPDYLANAVRIAQERPSLGAFGGKCLPEFEVQPDPWLEARGKGLGLRDRGEREEFFPEAAVAESGKVGKFERGQVKLRVTEFPDCAPIGAGMVLRRDAARAYAERLQARGERQEARGKETITDRKGDSLASGGDNDICLTVVEEGWQVGYLPQLQLTHLIPKQRMTLDYHKRMARDSMKSFILMLDQHGIRPWPAMARWTLPLRVASDWWRVKPWKGPDESLRFWGHVGMYEGRAALPQQGTRR